MFFLDYKSYLCALGLLAMSFSLLARESKRERQKNSDAIRAVVLFSHLAYRESLRKSPSSTHVRRAREAFASIKAKIKVKSSREKLARLLDELEQAAADKKDLGAIQQQIYNQALEFFPAAKAPAQTPDYVRGKKIYTSHCKSCHGEKGDPSQALARKFVPPALGFKESVYDMTLSPFDIVNALTIGIENTAKSSFRYSLSLHEMWSVAYFIMAERQKGQVCRAKACMPKRQSDLTELSLLSDAELRKLCPQGAALTPSCVGYLRRNVAFQKGLRRTN